MAGPYESVPFDNYIQLPIGLIPKAGNKTRMIFHLSFNFSDQMQSLNVCTPKHLCSVSYNNLDHAVRNCLLVSQEALKKMGRKTVFLGKTDLSMAFRVLPIKIKSLCWLVLKAIDPRDGKLKYFVDKCLPFGVSISCALCQWLSNVLRHIVEFHTKRKGITNYLDDFLFIAYLKAICDSMIQVFLTLCNELSIPVTMEKLEWSSTLIVFLGILLNGESLTLSIPLDKHVKAVNLLNDLTGKKKATIKQLQVLTGYLNFLIRAIFPGRVFTRRMYAKYSKESCARQGNKLKSYHHIKLDNEFRFDCEVWRIFLSIVLTMQYAGQWLICQKQWLHNSYNLCLMLVPMQSQVLGLCLKIGGFLDSGPILHQWMSTEYWVSWAFWCHSSTIDLGWGHQKPKSYHILR